MRPLPGWLRCALSQVRCVSGLLALALVQGMGCGWKTAVQAQLLERFHVTEAEDAWILSVFDLGGLLGAVLGVVLLVRSGSRRLVLFSALPCYALWVIITVAASNAWDLVAARLACGAGQGLLLFYMPIYIGEVATPQLRGPLVLSTAVLAALGALVSYAAATRLSVRLHALLPLPALGAAAVLLPALMLESPHCLAARGRWGQGAMWDTLRRLRRGLSEDAVRREAEALRDHMARQAEEAPTWRQTLSPPGTKLAAFVVLVTAGTSELIGAYTLIGAKEYFLHEAGAPISYFYYDLLFVLLMVAGSLLVLAAIERVGRRWPYRISVFLNGIAFAGLSAYYLIKEHIHSVSYTTVRWLPFVSMIIFFCGTSVGALSVPQVVLSEMLTERGKSLVVLAAALLLGISSFLINRLFLLVCTSSGFSVAFILYTIANFLNVMFTIDTMPETKGMSLLEVHKMLAVEENNFKLLNLAKRLLRPLRRWL